MEVTKSLKPSVKRVTTYGDSASVQAVTRVNAEQASKRTMRRPTRLPYRGRLIRLGERAKQQAQALRRGSGDGMYTRKAQATRETPSRGRARDQPTTREGWVGRGGVAEVLVVPLKSGNADGGKEPWFKADARSDEGVEIGATLRNSGVFRSCELHTMWKRREDSNPVRETRRPVTGGAGSGGTVSCSMEPSARTRRSHPRHRHPRLPEGESMMSCPRAGCGKSACPVR